MLDIEQLINIVVEASYTVHNILGPGFAEKVYKKALCHELRLREIEAREEVPITAYYKGINVGDFSADLLVDNRLILELKAGAEEKVEHECQLVNYLKSSDLPYGLLIYFGGYRINIKRKFRDRLPSL